jgi:bacterioferritin (cytochrome b1)
MTLAGKSWLRAIKIEKREERMDAEKNELVEMMNQALKMEHAARIQYLTHAELVKGLGAEKIIERLREIAGDEEKHEGKFRTMISNYLDGELTRETGETHQAKTLPEILKVNLQSEHETITYYRTIFKKLVAYREKLPLAFETLEHELRHIIIDEQEHSVELSLLLG